MKAEDDWIARGHKARQRGDWKVAIEAYKQALKANPECEAREALDMVMDILNFGNKQIYNV